MPVPLAELYQAAPVGLCFFDTQFRFRQINDWLAELNGLSVEAHLVRTVGEVLPDVAEGIESQLRQVIETGQPIVDGTVEAETPAFPGTTRIFQHSYRAIKSENGSIVGVNCTVQDITPRRRIEEAMRLAAGSASFVNGDEFFGTLVRRLTVILNVRHAFVSSLCTPPRNRLRLLGVAKDNVLGETFEYDTEGTPCWHVIRKGTRCFTSGVANRFPDDAWLQEEGIESYLAVPLHGSNSQPVGHLGVAHDDLLFEPDSVESVLNVLAARAGVEVERKQALAALAPSEARFRKVFEEGPLGMALVGMEYRLEHVNEVLCRMLGYTSQELTGLTFAQITHPEDIVISVQRAEQLAAGEKTNSRITKRYLHKNGDVVWACITSSFIRGDNGTPNYYFAMIEDVTERKRSEEQVQQHQISLRALASELTIAEERQRRELAVNLHDHVGQKLVAARLGLETLRSFGPERQARLKLAEVATLLEQTIEDVATLTFELCPPILYDLGLPAAIQWIGRQIEEQHGVKVKLVYTGGLTLSNDDLRPLLFRMIRELLTNTVKHAGAQTITVSLSQTAHTVMIAVRDDGVGFDRTSVLSHGATGSGFGLFSIRERLLHLGGKIDINSRSGQGTQVSLTVPADLVPSSQEK
jgi:PAS domain S-box-containing protein